MDDRPSFDQDVCGEGAGAGEEVSKSVNNVSSSTTAGKPTTTSLTTSETTSTSGIDTDTGTNAEVYFIGKILWAKGLDKMLELESYYKTCTGDYFAVDVYGNGPEEKVIQKAFQGRSFNTTGSSRSSSSSRNGASSSNSNSNSNSNQSTGTASDVTQRSKKNNVEDPSTDDNDSRSKLKLKLSERNMTFSTHIAKISRQLQATKQSIKSTTESIDLQFPKSLHELRKEPIPSSFPGRVDHATLVDYKIFVNPSESEVLCTTTAEALAMGKFVIIPVHPSNTFFMQFDNCLAYRNKLEFAANLHWALNREPEPLKEEQRRLLTWEAATERLVAAAAITRREAKERHHLGTSKLDERIAWFHNEVGKGARGDTLRRVLGGGPVAAQVAYEQTKHHQQPGYGDGDGDYDVEGLSRKFLGSSLVEAIRITLSNAIIPFQVPWHPGTES